MTAGSLKELVALSWEDLAMKIPDPPMKKKMESAREARRQTISNQKPKRTKSSTTQVDNVSYAQQKMNIFCTQPELDNEPRKLVTKMLLSIPPDQALQNLQKIYSSYYGNLVSPSNQRKGSFSSFLKKKSSTGSISSKAPVIEVTTFTVDFGLQEGTLCPLHENMTSQIVVHLKAGKGRFFWQLPNPDPAFTLEISPQNGTFKKKGDQIFSVTVNFNSSICLQEVVSLEVPGVGRFFFLISLESEHSVFGEDIRQYNENGKVEIPPALISMKKFLEASNAYKTSKIFLKDGTEEEVLGIRDKLNRDMFYDCRDVHSLAKVLLAWFSEQNPKILQAISENLLLSAGGQQECLSLLDMLKEPQKSIFVWLLDLMVEVVHHSSSNGVDVTELANVVGSTVYAPQSADATKNSQIPGAVAKFVVNLVNYRSKLRK